MAKILYLDYISFIIYTLMIAAFLLRTNKSSKRRGLFLLLLVVGILSTVYDICAVWLDNSGKGAVTLKYIMHIGYLILRNLITPVYGIYIIAVTDTWHRIRQKTIVSVLMWIPFSLAAVLTLTSPINHGVFYLNVADQYTRGPLFFILYVSAVFYLLFCICYVVKYIRILEIERTIPLFCIIPFQVAAIVIQLFYPRILVEMVATSLSLLLVLLTIERPDSKIDRFTGLYKSNAFYSEIMQSVATSKPLCVILISITNYTAISSYMSFENLVTIATSIGNRLEAVKTHLGVNAGIYNLENGLFTVILEGKEIPYGPRFASHALDTLKADHKVNKFSVSALMNVGVLRLPEDMDNLDEFKIVLNNFRKEKYTGKVMMASNIINEKDYVVMSKMDIILKNAIENDRFEVYYQPIYSVSEKRFNSAEALIRLSTEEYGFIRPDLFIPMAEESNAIHEIGLIVLEKVCQFISSDKFRSLNLDYIEVNLSAVQCSDKNLSDKINAVLKKYDVDPSKINLEITETASSFLQKNMLYSIYKLNEDGFSFSLDDFGTGYSNIFRVASLPLNIVKLDKSFTWTENNPDLKLILENSIKMIKKMGLKIVVEGVETKEMLETFEKLECEYIQGYYFSKPLPQYDFIQFINEYKIMQATPEL